MVFSFYAMLLKRKRDQEFVIWRERATFDFQFVFFFLIGSISNDEHWAWAHPLYPFFVSNFRVLSMVRLSVRYGIYILSNFAHQPISRLILLWAWASGIYKYEVIGTCGNFWWVGGYFQRVCVCMLLLYIFNMLSKFYNLKCTRRQSILHFTRCLSIYDSLS